MLFEIGCGFLLIEGVQAKIVCLLGEDRRDEFGAGEEARRRR